MADGSKIIYDDEGHARYFSFTREGSAATVMAMDARTVAPQAVTPQQAAKKFLAEHAEILQLPHTAMQSMDVRAAVAPVTENEALRFESEKHTMDSTVVSYNQTMFGLPIYQAGVSVVMHGADNSVKAATSTLHYDIAAQPPSDTLTTRSSLDNAATGAHDDVVRKAIPAAPNMRINRTRLMVYRYDAARREHHDAGEHGFGAQPPTLPLPPLPASIRDGNHYVVVEALFSYPLPDWGMLNWQAFIEPDSGAVLFLRALVDGATGLVFDRDPITKTGNLANMPTALSAILDALREPVALVNLGAPAGGSQSLAGTFVVIANVEPPTPTIPTTITPFNFAYVSRTDDFAAVNAYYHCDRFFRMVQDTGFNIAGYFDGTAFPVPVDHHALGNDINAECRGNSLNNGIGSVVFSLADLGSPPSGPPARPPIGIAADWRVVLHELGGHGILWDHVDSPNFGFAHSAGDSIAVILNDPATRAPDRFVSFPWVNIGRRHDRPVAGGWGWGGAHDVGGYDSEQILATSHFRLYRSIGGDSADRSRREFAAASAVYLILRAVSQLTPATNPPNPLAWEQQMETADAGVWTRTNPAETHAGGAYHKVIRWAFEKQGLFRSGPPVTAEGRPPAVDVYIDDGRHGEYPFQPNHWSCPDIWNRVVAGPGAHQEPIVGQTNFAYVRIKNRGTQPAQNVVVKAFHCPRSAGTIYPADWIAMATPQLPATNLAANDSVGVVVGPFLWVPTQVGHESMFFSVSAMGDASNIDGAVTGPIPEWRLVPHDNNIGQRNVRPVASPGQPFSLLSLDKPMHLLYRDANDHIADIYYDGTWGHQDLNLLAPQAPLANGDPVSVVFLNNQVHVLYRDANDHIADIYYDGAWVYQDLNLLAPQAPLANGDPTAVVFLNNQLHVVYRDANDHIADIYYDGAWVYQDLNALAPQAPLANGDPASVVFLDNQIHLIYRGANDHVADIYFYGGVWIFHDLSMLAPQAPLANGDPVSVVFLNNQMHVMYRGANDHIADIFYGGSWGYQDLSALAPQAPPAKGDPESVVFLDHQIHVVYRGANDHIVDIFYGGTWGYQDLNLFVPQAPLANGDPTSVVSLDNQIHVVYRGADDHIADIHYTGTWGYQDLTSLSA